MLSGEVDSSVTNIINSESAPDIDLDILIKIRGQLKSILDELKQ